MLDKFGVGIDIVKVSRFKNKPYLSNKKFYSKIFTNNEIKYCLNFKDPYPHFAGKFALKEATIKATRKKILIKEIETSHGKFDEPIVFSSKITLIKPSGLPLACALPDAEKGNFPILIE